MCRTGSSLIASSGESADNAFIESLKGKFRAECLNENCFLSLVDARDKIEQWRNNYNRLRRMKRR